MQTVASFRTFWCHSCRNQILLNTNSPNLACSRCGSELVEEVESFDQQHPSQFIPEGVQPAPRINLANIPLQFVHIITTSISNPHRGPPPASNAVLSRLEIVQDPEGECPICQELLKNNESKKMTCGHIFHSNCLIPWLNIHNTCPMCRIPLK